MSCARRGFAVAGLTFRKKSKHVFSAVFSPACSLDTPVPGAEKNPAADASVVFFALHAKARAVHNVYCVINRFRLGVKITNTATFGPIRRPEFGFVDRTTWANSSPWVWRRVGEKPVAESECAIFFRKSVAAAAVLTGVVGCDEKPPKTLPSQPRSSNPVPRDVDATSGMLSNAYENSRGRVIEI